MKKLTTLIAVVAIITSCGSSKKATAPNYHTSGDVEVFVPCSGSDYATDANHFRANAMGASSNMDVANQKALTSARAKLATTIESVLKSVADAYVSSYEDNAAEEFRGKFQSQARIVVNQIMKEVSIVCEKMMKGQDGQFKSYVAVEISREQIASQAADLMKKDSKLRTDFEYDRYQKIFKKEMSNYKE